MRVLVRGEYYKLSTLVQNARSLVNKNVMPVIFEHNAKMDTIICSFSTRCLHGRLTMDVLSVMPNGNARIICADGRSIDIGSDDYNEYRRHVVEQHFKANGIQPTEQKCEKMLNYVAPNTTDIAEPLYACSGIGPVAQKDKDAKRLCILFGRNL